jgi:hypothetical protein
MRLCNRWKSSESCLTALFGTGPFWLKAATIEWKMMNIVLLVVFLWCVEQPDTLGYFVLVDHMGGRGGRVWRIGGDDFKIIVKTYLCKETDTILRNTIKETMQRPHVIYSQDLWDLCQTNRSLILGAAQTQRERIDAWAEAGSRSTSLILLKF